MKRGEVWWASVDLPLDDGFSANRRRPVVLLSQDEASEVRMMLIVAPASTDISGVCVEVRVGATEGLPREGVLRVALPHSGHIMCDWLGTLAREDLIERMGALSSAKLEELENALHTGGLDRSR